MRRFAAMVLASMAALHTMGCVACRVCPTDKQPHRTFKSVKRDEAPRISLTGILVKPPQPREVAQFVPIIPDHKKRLCVGIPVKPNEWYATHHILKMCVEQDHPEDHYKYQLLFGPDWDSPAETVAKGMIKASKAGPEVGEGWVYIIEKWPQVQSHRVWAASSGTRAVLQVNTDGSGIERLFLFEGRFKGVLIPPPPGETQDECDLVSENGDTLCQLQPGEYYEISPDGVLSDPMPIAGAPPEVISFLVFVDDKARLAGMPSLPFLPVSDRKGE